MRMYERKLDTRKNITKGIQHTSFDLENTSIYNVYLECDGY